MTEGGAHREREALIKGRALRTYRRAAQSARTNQSNSLGESFSSKRQRLTKDQRCYVNNRRPVRESRISLCRAAGWAAGSLVETVGQSFGKTVHQSRRTPFHKTCSNSGKGDNEHGTEKTNERGNSDSSPRGRVDGMWTASLCGGEYTRVGKFPI